MQRPTAMFPPTPSGIGSNLIANILNSVIGNRLPSNMIRDTRPTQIQNAAINSLIQPANRNDFVRNVNQQPNLDPNNQQSNAWVNEKQSGMDARLSSFLQVNESNWGSRLASYYGLQQESGMAYNATG